MSVIACGNFGARPNPPKRPSNWPRTVGDRLLEDRRRTARRRGHGSPIAVLSLDGVRAAAPPAASRSPRRVAPRVVDRVEDPHEAGHARAVVGREVRAAEERTTVGVEEHRHRPAAAAGHRLDRLHVDGVDVGALLAVDLHVHEALVHDRGDRGVLERLVGHHVAPVARRVPDRQQDRLVLGPRPGERLLAPRVPVDRVVGVLAQVGAGLVGEAVHGVQATASLPRRWPSPAPTGSRACPTATARSASTSTRSRGTLYDGELGPDVRRRGRRARASRPVGPARPRRRARPSVRRARRRPPRRTPRGATSTPTRPLRGTPSRRRC